MDQGTIKADLEIRLLAGDLVIAVTRDPVLWQRVLAAITGSDASSTEDIEIPHPSRIGEAEDESKPGPLRGLAEELELPPPVVQTALAPSEDPPYIQLDSRTWGAFKKNFPARGKQAVSATALALTALALWFDRLGVDPPRIDQAQKVLNTIHVQGKNPTRSVKNCAWLQQRRNLVIISPAEIPEALAVLRAFCLRQPLEGQA